MKTVKFYKSGNTVRIMDYDDEQVVDKLPPAIYTICQDLMGFHLSLVSDRFEVPSKIYGSTNNRVDKILKTYDDRSRSTGVLMSGDKGSGKTMLSSLLCNKVIDRGLPVVLVERPYAGPGFIDFLNNIGECALFFDEFGKVFSRIDEDGDEVQDQNGLLSVFDGAHTIKRLILLTENETHKINDYMLNRPGRIYYHFKYSKLEEDLVREFCSANKVPENIIEAILLRIESSREFSFDALKAVVEEYQRFDEDIEVVFSNLNIEEPRSYDAKMKVIKIINTETNEELESAYDEVDAPSSRNTHISYRTGEQRANGFEITNSVYVSVKDLVERKGNRHVYDCKDSKILVVLEKIEKPTYPAYGMYLDV